MKNVKDIIKKSKKETHYIVQTAAACMPGSCWGRYGKVAVLEVDVGRDRVSMISTHAQGCHRVVEIWDRLNVGTTERCAFRVALRAAQGVCRTLNQA